MVVIVVAGADGFGERAANVQPPDDLELILDLGVANPKMLA
jgi:hypothetical protein